ncbi:hypothetical protein HPP92_006419 [Vanilla planifolia]|uniref:Hexosyltransferase n=1 Tax=Vanilla planifolia TaxID=51239 RepID=A0A835RIB2_VANPL|nr:hypothetical protein HPP92_006419 [Vanilla planifolia]
MKGSAAGVLLGKRRWRGPAVLVFSLVFLSVLFPPAFLLGVNKRFPSGFLIEDRFQLETSFFSNGRADSIQESFEGAHTRIDEVINKFGISSEKELISKKSVRLIDHGHAETLLASTGEVPSSKQNDIEYQSHQKDTALVSMTSQFHQYITDSSLRLKDSARHSRAIPMPEMSRTELSSSFNEKMNGGEIKRSHLRVPTVDSTCMLEFGSYCLWSVEHKELMKDSIVKRLKDQLFIARSYYPSIAKLKAQEKLSSKLKQNIQEHERILRDAISNADLPEIAMQKIKTMDEIIVQAKLCAVDCANIDRKLRQILDMTEEEAYFHMKQSAFLYNLGVQTVPKSSHCFFMRLSMEYFRSPPVDENLHANKIGNPDFNHYVVFSRNVLAASVTINSTVMNSEETEKMMFHIVTDEQNYYAMRFWFARNPFRRATIRVINATSTELSLSEEFQISIGKMDLSLTTQKKTHYISVFGHTHFLLPEIFKNMKKVVLLDDDLVVQQDLSSLWNLDMEGKVLAAVENCNVRFDHLKSYFTGYTYDPNSCAWTSGLNVVDLEKWREHNVTAIYNNVLWKVRSMDESSWKFTTLLSSLMSFQDLVYPLDSSWSLSGLGHDYWVGSDAINAAVTLHYNGNMKPWLELGIPRYKSNWRKFLKKGDRFMDDCNLEA